MAERVLVACEESQAVTRELRKRGVVAYSCDLLPTSGRNPEWHIQADALEIVKLDWDAVIAFPPCTHLAVSGAAWFKRKRANGLQDMAVGFFKAFTCLDHVPKVMIENPIGIMSRLYRKPDQIIQPYEFGDPFEKRTCLWLKGLPKLEPTDIVEVPPRMEFESGNTMARWYAEAWGLPAHERSLMRSKTFPGIARAIAEQWF